MISWSDKASPTVFDPNPNPHRSGGLFEETQQRGIKTPRTRQALEQVSSDDEAPEPPLLGHMPPAGDSTACGCAPAVAGGEALAGTLREGWAGLEAAKSTSTDVEVVFIFGDEAESR